MNIRLKIIFYGWICAFVVVGVRSITLMVKQKPLASKTLKKQTQKHVRLAAKRGNVYDRNQKLLAVSVKSYSFYTHPRLIKNSKSFVKDVSKFLEIFPGELSDQLKQKKKSSFLWLKRQVEVRDLKRIDALRKKYPETFGAIQEYKRKHSHDHVWSKIIGLVGADSQGLSGLEYRYQDVLKGTENTIFIGRDARGRSLYRNLNQIKFQRKKGDSLVLSLDSKLQAKVHDILKKHVALNSAKGACAMVLDLSSSSLLSMVSLPNYKQDQLKMLKSKKHKNYCVEAQIEPGSIVKPFLAWEALNNNIINLKDKIPVNKGKVFIGKSKITDVSRELRKRKHINLEELITLSSNVGSIWLLKKLGYPKFTSFLRELGFSKKTGIELGAEAKGLVKSFKNKKFNVEKATVSYGHGISVGLLQVVKAYRKLLGYNDDRPISVLKTTQLTQRSIDSNQEKVISFLDKNVNRKDGVFRARTQFYKSGGKTGTVRKVDLINGGYQEGVYVSNFVGFYPVKDPKYLVLVSVDEPQSKKRGYFASQVSAPIYKEIADFMILEESSERVVSQENIEKPRVLKILNKKVDSNSVKHLTEVLREYQNDHRKIIVKGNSLRVKSVKKTKTTVIITTTQ